MKKSNILTFIQDLKKILVSSEDIKSMYKINLERLEEKERVIKNGKVRAAIMGVTSSGKSTLVNAVLGEGILPTAIRPSSSIDIICSYGIKRQAVIFFKDGKEQVLQGKELNDKVIKKYADEGENPGNKFGIKEIHITTPSFKLAKNIEIIDSPGLDACNLDSHERLTLEVLLPIIDICIFLTTVKASSDAVNAEKIKIVHQKGKQIILVQNMIDSVEPKIGKDGVIIEDEKSILQKHSSRAEKLLREATGNDNNYEVIQISAKYACDGIMNSDKKKYDESSFDNFIKAINMCIERLEPEINNERINSIRKEVLRLISTSEKVIGKDNEKVNDNIMPVSDFEFNEFKNEFSKAKNNIRNELKEINIQTEKFIKDIEDSYEEELSGYENIIDEINKFNEEISNTILKVVKDREKEKQLMYEKLNISMRDEADRISICSEKVDLKFKYETRKHYSAKEGLFSGVSRFFGDIFNTDWGYDVYESDEKVIDKDATIEAVRINARDNNNRYVELLEKWSLSYERVVDEVFEKEINRIKEDYKIKKEKKIKIEGIEKVISSLQNILNKQNFNDAEVEVAMDRVSSEKAYSHFQRKEEKIDSKLYDLYKLSNVIVNLNYEKVGQYLLKEGNEKLQGKVIQIFWTWDIEQCMQFLQRINKDKASEFKADKCNGIYEHNDIWVLDAKDEGTRLFKEKISELKNKNINLYIVLNAMSIGSSENHIRRDTSIVNFIKDNKVICNYVIDSQREFINADNIDECIKEVEMLRERLHKELKAKEEGYILLNSRNPIFNILLIECQNQEKLRMSDYKRLKVKLYQSILLRSELDKKQVEKILNYYTNK